MGFQVPRMAKCCCCIPLRTGALIIGYISIVMSLVTVGMMSFAIYAVSQYVKKNANGTVPDQRPTDVQNTALGLYMTFAFYLVVFTLNIIISTILVYGAHTRQPKYLKIFCNAVLFLFSLSIALVVLTCVFMGILPTIGILKWGLTLLMVFIIVRSAYLEMEDQEKTPMPYELQPYGTGAQAAPLMA